MRSQHLIRIQLRTGQAGVASRARDRWTRGRTQRIIVTVRRRVHERTRTSRHEQEPHTGLYRRARVLGAPERVLARAILEDAVAARLYSLVQCAKANGLEPYAYLRRVFTELPKAQSLGHIEALQSTRLTPGRPDLNSAPRSLLPHVPIAPFMGRLRILRSGGEWLCCRDESNAALGQHRLVPVTWVCSDQLATEEEKFQQEDLARTVFSYAYLPIS